MAAKKKTFDEAVDRLNKSDDLSADEAAALDDPNKPLPAPRNVPRSPEPPPAAFAGEGDGEDDSSVMVSSVDELPAWVKVPPAQPTDGTAPFALPRGKGKQIIAVKIPAAFTDYPEKGDRQCIMWSMTLADERTALRRAQGRRELLAQEFTMQMIRAIDGMSVDWTRRHRAADPLHFYDEIGPKMRAKLENIYQVQHNLTEMEQLRFFGECIALVTGA